MSKTIVAIFILILLCGVIVCAIIDIIWCVLNDEDNQESIPDWYTND